jgi:hypothetical protein
VQTDSVYFGAVMTTTPHRENFPSRSLKRCSAFAALNSSVAVPSGMVSSRRPLARLQHFPSADRSRQEDELPK